MKVRVLGLLLLSAPAYPAAFIELVPRLDAVPAIVLPAVPYAPALSSPASLGPALAAPALLAASPAAALSAPAATLPVPAALAPSPFAAPQSGPERNSGEMAATGAGRPFDGTDGWSRGSFENADGLSVTYKRRAGPVGTAPRVYSGGLAFNNSFDALFARNSPAARPEYFVWTRGHRPTGWIPTAPTLDADARDLARMIVVASRETGSSQVELALHSYGTLVFQRLSQLASEPEVAEALKRLSGSRVVLLNAVTHYAGSANRADPLYEAIGQTARQSVDMLDVMDRTAESWKRSVEWNPFLAASMRLWLAGYRAQREQLLAIGTAHWTDHLRKDLEEPWDPAFDSVRRDFLAALELDSKNAVWQEALTRRSSDLFRLEFTKKDVARLRRLKIRVDLIHSANDQLLNWESARTIFELFAIPSPEKMPAPGTVLTDPSGLFRAEIVDADHYYPLKQRDALAARLDP